MNNIDHLAPVKLCVGEHWMLEFIWRQNGKKKAQCCDTGPPAAALTAVLLQTLVSYEHRATDTKPRPTTVHADWFADVKLQTASVEVYFWTHRKPSDSCHTAVMLLSLKFTARLNVFKCYRTGGDAADTSYYSGKM